MYISDVRYLLLCRDGTLPDCGSQAITQILVESNRQCSDTKSWTIAITPKNGRCFSSCRTAQTLLTGVVPA